VKPGRARRQLNLVAVCQCIFMPWILFLTVYGVCSFSVRYKQPHVMYLICTLGLVLVLATANAAKTAKQNNSASFQWLAFGTAALLIAFIAGIVFGDLNYWYNNQPYYDVGNLQYYPSVDPSSMKGQQLMDAGRIEFVEGSQLDLTKTMGFKNVDWYCAAPVVKAGAAAPASYDFWAVGLNCCSGNSADFHCGEFNNPKATAGLRLMNDGQRSFYRLAVQQAEAAYNIKAVHPLFFHWMQDPIAEMNAYQDDGLKYFLLGMFAQFAFQLFLVVIATIAFSKMGFY